MPPRQGQLDEISAAIGELKGSMTAIERYIHDNRHEVANASQKIDALGVQIGKDIAKVEARLEAKLDNFKAATDARLTALEQAQQKEAGARGMVKAILNSPVVAWLFAAAVMVWTYLQTHGGVK